MLSSLLYFLFALLGLGFLIFIHELGHYFMARRVGMRVESFGIGFGKPIYTFVRKGVKWNICWLPFGGYVKIAGMEKEGNVEPQDVPDGFFGKSPWDRILVAIMGPAANLVLAFILFAVLWISGGRDKHYSDVTKKIGWVDPRSELYTFGIRPGDEIFNYDGHPVRGAKDHFQAAMMSKDLLHISGRRFNSETGEYSPFSLVVKPYPHPMAMEKGIVTAGVLAPASYLVYQPDARTGLTIPKSSPLYGSGIEPGDRIVWVDGERIYSLQQLTNILNDGRSLCTVKRGEKTLLRRVPRVFVDELKLDNSQKEELKDWQWEAGLHDKRFSKLLFTPYNLTADGRVESRFHFIDDRNEALFFPRQYFSSAEEPLLPGDDIIAIDGIPVSSAYEFLSQLQDKKVEVIIERRGASARMAAEDADSHFDSEYLNSDLMQIASSIGTQHPVHSMGNLILLSSVRPCTRSDLFAGDEREQQFLQELEEEKRHIQAIDDPQKRDQALRFLEKREKQLLLGLPNVQDVHVTYNPNPFVLFRDVVDEVASTLSALIGGYLSPKWLSGPIGIVQVIHTNWMVGVKEALFWIATISLNLGLLNLLPLPVLDGGYICLSLFEIITGQRLKAKTIEKIVIPFAILLIAFLVFLTYNDIARIVTHLLH